MPGDLGDSALSLQAVHVAARRFGVLARAGDDDVPALGDNRPWKARVVDAEKRPLLDARQRREAVQERQRHRESPAIVRLSLCWPEAGNDITDGLKRAE